MGLPLNQREAIRFHSLQNGYCLRFIDFEFGHNLLHLLLFWRSCLFEFGSQNSVGKIVVWQRFEGSIFPVKSAQTIWARSVIVSKELCVRNSPKDFADLPRRTDMQTGIFETAPDIAAQRSLSCLVIGGEALCFSKYAFIGLRMTE